MNLLDRFVGATGKPTHHDYKTPEAVTQTDDLARILALPRRPRPTDAEFAVMQDALTAKLGKGKVACVCESVYKRRCPDRLNPLQAWALTEAPKVGGILGPIPVGGGKTLLNLLTAMVMPGVNTAVLLIPPQLRDQLLTVDWKFYEQHWHLPNLAGGRWFTPGRPALHVVAFSELSGSKATDLLGKLKPDLFIVDEAHLVRNKSASRTMRFLRYFVEHPETKLCCWSGTLTSKSIRDYAHLSAISLRDGSPVPHLPEVVEEWGDALDPNDFPAPPGALTKLATRPGQTAMEGFQQRLLETPGVISSQAGNNCPASLDFYERKVTLPSALDDMIREVHRTWTRPDGEELVEAIAKARCVRELACGFYYRWKWPRGEPLAVIDRWLNARKAWHRELREKLKDAREHLDSPLLCAKAAIRAYDPAGYDGPLPVWRAATWPEWVAVRDSARPETEAVWVDDFLVRDAADWLATHTGIAWYDHDAFGKRLRELAVGVPFFGPGDEASAALVRESGKRSVIASARAHGTGKNLQMFNENLLAIPTIADGAAYEQLIGRTHRPGQLADVVRFDCYRHTPDLVEAFDRATTLSGHIVGTFGGTAKLLIANLAFSP